MVDGTEFENIVTLRGRMQLTGGLCHLPESPTLCQCLTPGSPWGAPGEWPKAEVGVSVECLTARAWTSHLTNVTHTLRPGKTA